MSVSTEVHRTLVKSPPELWSELSNPEALSRHLADLGEIRITSVEPETKVEWESEVATGVVHLKQSGWGTKVTLSVARVLAQACGAEPAQVSGAEPIAAEPAAEPIAAEPVAGPIAAEPVAAEAAAGPITAKPLAGPIAAEPEQVAEPCLPSELHEASDLVSKIIGTPNLPDPEPNPKLEIEPAPEPRLRFFPRLFRRRKTKPRELVEAQPEPQIAADHEPEIEVVALAVPEPIYPDPPVEPKADLAAELEAVEAQMEQETTALLTGVLDRLGAAHHRPFSRG